MISFCFLYFTALPGCQPTCTWFCPVTLIHLGRAYITLAEILNDFWQDYVMPVALITIGINISDASVFPVMDRFVGPRRRKLPPRPVMLHTVAMELLRWIVDHFSVAISSHMISIGVFGNHQETPKNYVARKDNAHENHQIIDKIPGSEVRILYVKERK